MKKIIKKIVPKKYYNKLKAYYVYLQTRRQLRLNVKRDYQRFKKHNFNQGSRKNLTVEQLKALIVKTYHSIEKGLSYKDTKYEFGEGVLLKLIVLLKDYENKSLDKQAQPYSNALVVLNEYIKLHGEDYNSNGTIHKIQSFLNNRKSYLVATNNGSSAISKKEIISNIQKSDFKSFSESRHSVREYSKENVNEDTIVEAINIAKKTPSACNRQSWFVRIVKESKNKQVLLDNQNGNRGWGHEIDTLLIVTTDNQFFTAPRERNQSYIDGGMFSMSLLYALHAQKLATCSLSGALKPKQEHNIRNHFNIKESENIIMFIAVGHYVEKFKVPVSKRYDTKDFYINV